MPRKKVSKQKISKKLEKEIQNKNIELVDSDSDDIMINEESDKNEYVDKFGMKIGGQENERESESESDEEDYKVEDYNQDSEIEDEDKLEDNVEIEDEDVDFGKEECFYKYADDLSEDDEIEEFFDDEEGEVDPSAVVSKDERITKPIMTKYERVRLLGIRTRQIALGAKPMIKNPEGLSSRQIAELELENNIIPLIVVRPIPNGKKEYWKVAELAH